MTTKFFVMFLLFIWLCSTMNVAVADIGTAATYQPPYAPTKCGGNRRDQFPPGNMFIAVGEGLWDNGAACGRKYRLKCLSGSNKPCKGGTIDVKVIDFCPKCSSTIVMSNDAFSSVSNASDRIIVEYIQL
uniref:Expansin-like EG45 domain-containing protein n=2 Tax=Kalanchoe fedtschenkoi TaxID=63787 RepID=A0A7N0TD36_KALFE